MRYVPNLISPAVKVLPGYFKGSIYASKPANPVVTVLLWVAAVLFFFFAIASLLHPLLALVFGSIGLILLPPGQRFIERTLRFRLTTPVKYISVAVLFIISMPLTSHYAVVEVKAAVALQNQLDHAAAAKVAAEKAAQDKKDSLLFYLHAAAAIDQGLSANEATEKIDYAAKFASNDSDRVLIGKAKTHVMSAALFAQVKQGKYASALAGISDLMGTDPNNAELLYQRAICYSKTGHVGDAVHDLAPLVAAGNEDAVKLHDKINPLTRHVAYYTTRCRDGSSSSAKGRGACSAHGGVANWNEPVYETSRKY